MGASDTYEEAMMSQSPDPRRDDLPRDDRDRYVADRDRDGYVAHDRARDARTRDVAYADGEAHGRMLDIGLLLLRLFMLALVFHGFNKLTHASGFIGGLENFPVGRAAPELFGWMIILGQLALPILVAIGLFTRASAALIAIMMIAIWIFVDFMSPDYSFLGEHGEIFGEGALLYAWLAIPLIFTGAGRYSLDWNLFGSKGRRSY